jgi:hypothetical protein
MNNTQGTGGTVVELAVSEFDSKWRQHYDAVFSGRDIDKAPFRDPGWRVFPIGAPAYYFESYTQPLTTEQQQHIAIYDAIGRCARQLGDSAAVSFLRDGPHLNPSIFCSQSITAASIYALRQSALDGFDRHVFSASEGWALAMLWDEEIAVIGGNSAFESAFIRSVGGEATLKKDFELFSAYLLTLSSASAEIVRLLAAQAGW